MADTDAKDARIAELEGAQRELVEALGTGSPFPVVEVLTILADAEDHLRHHHNCDDIGHERRLYAQQAARRIVAALPAALARVSQQAPACDCGAKGIACVHFAMRVKEQQAPAQSNVARLREARGSMQDLFGTPEAQEYLASLRGTTVPRAELDAMTAQVAVLVDALQALLAMSDRGPCPQKLDEALTWRQNDELAHSKAVSALAPERARRVVDLIVKARAWADCETNEEDQPLIEAVYSLDAPAGESDKP